MEFRQFLKRFMYSEKEGELDHERNPRNQSTFN